MRPPSQSLRSLPKDLATASLACALLPANCQAKQHHLPSLPRRRSCPQIVSLAGVYPVQSCTHFFPRLIQLEPTYMFSRTHLKPKLIHSPSVLVPTLFPPQPLFPIHAELASFEIQILTAPAFAFCSISAQRPSPHRASAVSIYVP
jgi:hypothetical protein